jgi:hypothetical protein
MTCRKALKLMPLFVGDDLGPRTAPAVRAHVDACPACRRELDGIREALARVKAAARAESLPDWSEAEWKALMARAVEGGQAAAGGKERFGRRAPRPRWAAASALGALIGLAVLSVLFRGPVPGPGPVETASRPIEAEAPPDQDVVSMTVVSQETGLQIVWFFDKKFDYEGVHK